MAHEYKLIEIVGRSYGNAEKSELTEVIKGLPFTLSMQGGPWIAGGAVRRTLLGEGVSSSDIDLFFADAEQLAKTASALEGIGAKLGKKSEHAKEYMAKIGDAEYRLQLISIGFYANAPAVLDSFDFTICQFATDGEVLVAGDYALWDLGRKRLAIHKLTYAVASLRRVLKYTGQGFTACSGMMTDFLEQVAKNPQAINSKVQYID
jgi:hypothetical protein